MGDIMKKKFIKCLFIIFVSFMCLSVAEAKQEMICTYKSTSNVDGTRFNYINDIYFVFNDDYVKVEKIIQKTEPENKSECIKNECAGLTTTDKEYSACTQYCSSKTETYSNVKTELSNLEDGNCPESIVISGGNINGFVVKEGSSKNLVSEKKTYTSKVYCGREEQGRLTQIPKKVPELTSTAVTIIQIAIPIILVILGSLDLFKGITAGKEDEMKKGQQLFVKRLITGAMIFFIVVIVKFFISIVADTNESNMADCIECFISNDCKEDFS